MSRHEQRRDKLRAALRQAGAGGILVTNFVNVSYLTGFTGDDSYLLVTGSGAVLISDSRYAEQLKEECPGLDCEIRTSATPIWDVVAKVARKATSSGGPLAVESESISLASYERLQGALPKQPLVSSSGLVESLREIKDAEEVAAIREAVQVAERAFGVVKAGLRPELSERQVAFEIEHQIRQFGGRGCSFPPIVAAGPRAALPHAQPQEALLGESDFVLVDWGAVGGERYVSDLTRVLVTGKIRPKLERIYEVVLRAQQRAIEAIRPGVSLHDVDAAARDLIADAGFGKRFGHSLGHGIGLEIHEAPRVAARQDRPLQVGMVITVEPGIYVPNWGGVRIEDDVLVTRGGHEVLTHVPKELADCVVS